MCTSTIGAIVYIHFYLNAYFTRLNENMDLVEVFSTSHVNCKKFVPVACSMLVQ